MAFIFLRTDAFLNRLKSEGDTEKKQLLESLSKRSIRRPYRGIQIKDDTYSTLSVLKPNGKPILLISSSDTNSSPKAGRTGKVREYADYIIQSISEQRVEKQQIIETFGDAFVYFFGERPRMVEVQGLLLNTEDFNWKSQFWKNYEENLRGTKLVQANARVYLSFDTTIIEGYILQAQSQQDSESPYSVPFGFSMLATGYYDWSDIGQTRFPGFDKEFKDIKIRNRELEDRRSTFVSTGSQVRLRNLLAGGSGGVLSTLRSGIRTANSGISAAANLVSKVQNVVGGRTIRVPIGIAGFLQSTGAATIGAGSIGGSAVLSASGLGKQFDAATGTFKGVNGSVKLRIPGAATFAPTWISRITNQPRGYIHENYDEYPTRDDPETLKQLMAMSGYIDLLTRRAHRQMAIGQNDFALAVHNQVAQMGGTFDDLSDVVKFTKANFGMLMSTVALARNFPEGALNGLKASLGIGIGTTSQSRIQGRAEELEPELQKFGLKTAYEDKTWKDVGNFIGGNALKAFGAAATANVDDPTPATLGETYESAAAYQPASGDSLTYEPAYGDQNYSDLLDTDPETQVTLDEVYGSSDTGSDLDPASLSEVYGTGSSSDAIRTPEEIAAILAAQVSNTLEADEDVSGITGIGDDEAPIEPVI